RSYRRRPRGSSTSSSSTCCNSRCTPWRANVSSVAHSALDSSTYSVLFFVTGSVSLCSGNPQCMGHMAILIRPREFIVTLGGGVAVCPLAAGAQEGAQLVRRIGVLSGFAEDPLLESELLRPLSQLNRENGRNMQIDLRWGAGDIDRIRIMAKELVASQPEIVITVGTPATVAVQRETRTIPIVFLVVADPVGAGIVNSLARPGGNTTGFGNPEGTFGGKLLSLLKGIAPV